MSDAHWDVVQKWFHAAAALPAHERHAFLESSDASPDVIREVLALLDEDAAAHALLDGGLAQIAVSLLDSSAHHVPVHQFGPYRLTELLGEGGAGVVYRAERMDIGGVAAIKILRDAGLSPSRRARFVAEQRTLARLRHPGIAQLFDADSLPNGTPWFAMELVDGTTLMDYCAAHDAALVERLRLFRQIGEAVQHAHGHAVIHRDLKPSNVLVTETGRVKLLDFGVAKQLDADTLDQTRTGLRMMTPAYAAPEQVRAEPVGVHTDVYSLGVILYELLTGRLPFDLTGRSPAQAARILTEHEVERPSLLARRHRPPLRLSAAQWADLDVVVLTAMQRDPPRRYRTVHALLRDIEHFERGEPLDARPDSVRYRTGKFLRRHRRAVTASALALAALFAVSAWFTTRLTSARDVALTEAAATQRIQQFMLSLFQGSDDEVLSPDSLRVSTLLERGLHEAAALDAEPSVQAELVATIGGIYGRLGEFERADSLLQAALVSQQALEPDAGPDTARRLIAIAQLRVAQARYDEAERRARDALAIARRTLPHNHDVVIDATETLGLVQQERGAYDDATATLQQAIQLRLLGDTTSTAFAGALVQLANTHFYAGRYDDADSLNQRALKIYRRLRGDAHPLVADVLVNLGAVHFQRGRYPLAERFYRDALAIITPWFGEDHHQTASGLTMLARALIVQDRYDEADDVLHRALTIRERVMGSAHPAVASTLNELGSVALHEERLDDARATYRRMLDIYRGAYGNDHWLIGIATSNLGAVAMAEHDYATAEARFREAADLFALSQGPEHLNTGIARVKLGRALLRQNRWAQALDESRAGLAIVQREAGADVSWAASAREDIAAAETAAN